MPGLMVTVALRENDVQFPPPAKRPDSTWMVLPSGFFLVRNPPRLEVAAAAARC